MYCPKCGWNNPDDAVKCANCYAELKPSQPQQPQQTQQMPPQQAPQRPYAQQPYAQQPYAQQPQGGQPAEPVPDYMVWSIVSAVISLFCCFYLPVSVAFSIVAIVKSSQANQKKTLGDFFGALADANAAKTWLWWAVGIDIVGLIGWIIVFVAAFVNSGMKHNF